MLQKPVIERLLPKLAQPKIGPHLEVPPFLLSLQNVRKEIREEQSLAYSFRLYHALRFPRSTTRPSLTAQAQINHSIVRLASHGIIKAQLDSDDALHISPSPTSLPPYTYASSISLQALLLLRLHSLHPQPSDSSPAFLHLYSNPPTSS